MQQSGNMRIHLLVDNVEHKDHIVRNFVSRLTHGINLDGQFIKVALEEEEGCVFQVGHTYEESTVRAAFESVCAALNRLWNSRGARVCIKYTMT